MLRIIIIIIIIYIFYNLHKKFNFFFKSLEFIKSYIKLILVVLFNSNSYKLPNNFSINNNITFNKKFNNDKYYDCIISINVHEKFNFLLKQLECIKMNVNLTYAVILNCNDYMFNECKKYKLPNNVYINNIILNKKRFHGSLLNGIYNNMVYGISNFNFKYFIVASSRSFFGNNLRLKDLNRISKNKIVQKNDYNKWWWPLFKQTLLAKYYLEHNKNLYKSPHEGLVFNEKCCLKIINFIENNPIIKNDLFNFEGCVEEFAFQTIAINLGENFYYIGNGTKDKKLNINNKNKFMYKIIRN